MEYLLPHNDKVIKPRALNTFLGGLAELGVHKRLIKNKKILSNLLEKETAYRESENEADDDSDSNDSSDVEKTASEESDSEEVIQTKKSFKKNPPNHVIIVKIGLCLPLRC